MFFAFMSLLMQTDRNLALKYHDKMFGLISYWLIWFEQSIGNIKRPDLNTYKDIDGIDNRNLYDVFKIGTPKKDGFNFESWPGNR